MSAKIHHHLLLPTCVSGAKGSQSIPYQLYRTLLDYLCGSGLKSDCNFLIFYFLLCSVGNLLGAEVQACSSTPHLQAVLCAPRICWIRGGVEETRSLLLLHLLHLLMNKRYQKMQTIGSFRMCKTTLLGEGFPLPLTFQVTKLSVKILVIHECETGSM